jgi:hypothetical protein
LPGSLGSRPTLSPASCLTLFKSANLCRSIAHLSLRSCDTCLSTHRLDVRITARTSEEFLERLRCYFIWWWQQIKLTWVLLYLMSVGRWFQWGFCFPVSHFQGHSLILQFVWESRSCTEGVSWNCGQGFKHPKFLRLQFLILELLV